MTIKSLALIALLLALSAIVSAQSIELRFENTFNGQPLELKKEYTTAQGEPVSFSLLNYFISNIKLTRTDGSVYEFPPETCYILVKQSEPRTQSVRIPVPEGEYSKLTYLIGVDSLRSTLGADKRTGVLDVGGTASGMYWQWNSGYIFFKLEGKSTASRDSLRHGFYYHIGGYGGFDKPMRNNIRSKTLAFEKPLKTSPKKNLRISIDVQIDRFFAGERSIKIGEHYSVMGGDLSSQIADNYVDIFVLSNAATVKAKK